ncbi:DUF3307 domain-containing protein [Candidatus Parcubacteria bacterium]|jgi:hypothetical protein|nr:MAG: DUF3307 domain-containing protein [Candidatus Parcubacteria bacterium]
MFLENFVFAIIGHFVGDFLTQPKTMAIKKGSKGLNGFLYCLLHAIIYATIVCFFIGATSVAGVLIWLAILVPHFIIDRWSLTNKWLGFIHSRTFEGAFNSSDKYREFDIAFTAVVYTIADTTIHILCLLPVIKYLL